jgi:hypothetical protein
MASYARRLALLALLASTAFATPSLAQQMGTVRISVAKAAWVLGAGGGRGILTFRGREYPFRVSGLSYGVSVGASLNRLEGEAFGIREVGDFAGHYDAVGAGGALVGGIGAVHLQNKKGVRMELRGAKAGMEFSANVTNVKISFR